MAFHRLPATTAALAAIALALAGCTGDSGGDDAGGPAGRTVSIEGNAFSPQSLSIPAGTTVAFHNIDPRTHTATAVGGAFDTGDLGEHETSEPIAFSTPGTFSYKCQRHPSMTGTITVTA